MICAGIDAGSRSIKAVLFDTDAQAVCGAGVADQGVRQDSLAAELFDRVLAEAGLSRRDIRKTTATGYGRNTLTVADCAVTEVTCHAQGVRRLAPEARMIVDIGGQDSKIVWLDGRGLVRDFAMNDRCAAGTGRFLEVLAARLDVGIGPLGEMARRSRTPAPISSTCVVFAETEIVGMLATGVPPEDIAAGVQASIAARVAAMAGSRVALPVVLTGGVALVPGMDVVLQAAMKSPICVAPQPQLTGALGAALLAARECGWSFDGDLAGD